MKAATLIHRTHAALAKTGSLAMVIITSATTMGLTSSLHAGPPLDDAKMVTRSPLEDYHPMYLGTFNTGVKTSDVYTEGNVSFVVPVWSSLGTDGTLGGGMVFITPYVSVGEQGEMASSLGLGWRYLFSDQSISALRSDEPAGFLTEGFYIGANVFVDNLRTHFDNDFWQLGIGAEIGSRYLELRGNYYLPFDSSEKLAERRTDTQTYTTRSTSSSAGTVNSVRADAPFASGNTLQQDAYLTTTAVTATRTTTTRTTVKTVTELYEEGMEGWDLEAAFLIPGIDRFLDVTLLAGYYSFDNQPFGPQRGGSGTTEGFKAGLEIRPVPAVVLTGMWYEDEGLTGSDWVAGVGLQIPLSKDWMDAFKPRRRHLIERLAEPVARQNAAIKTSLSYDQKHDVKQTSSTQTAVTRRVVTQSQQRITIAEDVIFVNNGGDVGNGIEAGSSSGDGTAENPLNTIQAGADLAGNNNVSTQRIWNVYTQGAGAHGGSTYNESITISASTNFLSSASLIGFDVTGINGTGDRPWVNGGFAANAANFLAGSTTDHRVGIDGYNISGGYQSSASIPQVPVTPYALADGDGIHLNDVKTFAVVDNRISNTATGVTVWSSAADVVGAITSNILSSNTESGLTLTLVGSNSFTGNILGNTANNNTGSGYNVAMIGVNTWNGSFVLNTANENGMHGANVSVEAQVNGDFAANTFIGNDGDGLSWFIADVVGGIYSNTLKDNGTHGINIGGTVTEGIFNNTVSGNLGYGIVTAGFGASNFSIFNNLIDDNGDIGVYNYGGLVGDIYNNIITNNTGDGVRITEIGDYTGDIYGNIIASNGGNGIYVYLLKDDLFSISLGTFTGDIYNNAIGSNGSHGIFVSTQGKFTGDVTGNQLLNNAGAGIAIRTHLTFSFPGPGTADIESNVTNNIVVNNGGGGIGVDSSGEFIGNIADNYIVDNGASGLVLSAGGTMTGSISENEIRENGGAGVHVSSLGDMDLSLIGNIISGSSGNGIEINADTFTGDISENIIHNNEGHGIVGDTSWYSGDLINNIVLLNSGDGVRWQATSVAGNISGNTIAGNESQGIYLEGFLGIDVDINHNAVYENAGHGISIQLSSIGVDPIISGNIENNIVLNNGGSGLYMSSSGSYYGDIINNDFVGNGGFGLELWLINGQRGNIIENNISLNGSDGIRSVFRGLIGDISGNAIGGNGGDGINYLNDGVYGRVINNTTSENVGHGININQGTGPTNSSNIEIANNTVYENGGSGIVLSGGTEGSIHHNIIYDNTLHGIHVEGELTGDIYNNAVAGNGGNGILIGQEVSDPSSPLSFEGNVYGNTTNGNDLNGILINGAVAVTGDIYNNTSNGNGEDGIAINLTFDNGTFDIFKDFTGDIYNNELNGNLANGLSMELFGDFRGNIANNEAIGNAGHGIYAYLQFSDFYSYGGEFIGNISDNATHDNGGSGIYVFTLNHFSGNVFNNEAHNNGSTGVSVGGQEGLFGNLNNNYTDGNSSGGIAVTGAIIGSVYSNVSTNNTGHGISFTAQGLVDADIYGNVITGNTGDGIFIRTFGGSFPVGIGIANYQGDIYSNVINDNGGTAINIRTDGEIISNVTGNQIIGNGAGIKLDTDILAFGMPTAGIQGSVQNNILLDNSGIGILLITAGEVAANVSGNYVVNSGADGIQIVAGMALPGLPPSPVGFGSVNGNITSNVIAGSGGNGLSVNAASTVTGSISSNTISTSMGDGIYLQLGGLNGDVSSNISIQNQGAGINFTSSGDINGDIQNNTTSNNIGSGFILNQDIFSSITFSGAFNGNTSNLNGGFGFSTDISTLAPGGGPYSPNTAAGNTLGNFNNAGAPVANP